MISPGAGLAAAHGLGTPTLDIHAVDHQFIAARAIVLFDALGWLAEAA